MHKEQLLEKKEVEITSTLKKHHYLQRIVISNSLTRKDSLARLENRIQNRGIDFDHNLEEKKTKNINEEKIVEFLNKKFGVAIESIVNKINSGNIGQIKFIVEVVRSLNSEKHLMTFLKKYNLINNNINSKDDLIKSVEKFFETEISKLLESKMLIDLLSSLDDIAGYYDNNNFEILMEANKFYVDTIYDRENFRDRLELFDLLYDAGSLIGGAFKAHYECIQCDDDVFAGNVKLNVRPSKVKLKCPNCNKEVFYLAPYKIEDTLFDDIQSKDGLLHAAVLELLKSHEVKFISNARKGNDIELDVLVLNKSGLEAAVIEVKMFKTDRPHDTLLANLKEGLKAFLKAREKLIALNAWYEFITFHYLTNISDEALLMDLKLAFKADLLGKNAKIHNVKSFGNYFDENAHLFG